MRFFDRITNICDPFLPVHNTDIPDNEPGDIVAGDLDRLGWVVVKGHSFDPCNHKFCKEYLKASYKDGDWGSLGRKVTPMQFNHLQVDNDNFRQYVIAEHLSIGNHRQQKYEFETPEHFYTSYPLMTEIFNKNIVLINCVLHRLIGVNCKYILHRRNLLRNTGITGEQYIHADYKRQF